MTREQAHVEIFCAATRIFAALLTEWDEAMIDSDEVLHRLRKLAVEQAIGLYHEVEKEVM